MRWWWWRSIGAVTSPFLIGRLTFRSGSRTWCNNIFFVLLFWIGLLRWIYVSDFLLLFRFSLSRGNQLTRVRKFQNADLFFLLEVSRETSLRNTHEVPKWGKRIQSWIWVSSLHMSVAVFGWTSTCWCHSRLREQWSAKHMSTFREVTKTKCTGNYDRAGTMAAWSPTGKQTHKYTKQGDEDALLHVVEYRSESKRTQRLKMAALRPVVFWGINSCVVRRLAFSTSPVEWSKRSDDDQVWRQKRNGNFVGLISWATRRHITP